MSILYNIIYILLIFGLNYVFSEEKPYVQGLFNGPLEEWVEKKKKFGDSDLKRLETLKPKEYKIKNKLFTRTVRQYLGDLYCKTKYPGSSLRCHENVSNCTCVKKSFASDSIAKSCLYGDHLTNCLGTTYSDRKYILEPFNLFKEENVCPVDRTWNINHKWKAKKSGESLPGEDEGENEPEWEDSVNYEPKESGSTNIKVSKTDIDHYFGLKPRGVGKMVKEILENYGSNPVKDVYSDLYYSLHSSSEKTEPFHYEDFVHELGDCIDFKSFEIRHGLDLSSGICTEDIKLCDLKDQYSYCKSVEKRYYVNTGEEFYLDIENYSLSNVFSIVLVDKNSSCTDSNKKLAFTKDEKIIEIPIMDEINLSFRRMFHFGPFKPIDKEDKYLICACSNHQTFRSHYSCVNKEDYDIAIGELIVKDKTNVKFTDTEINTEIKIELKSGDDYSSKTVFMIESSLIDSKCTSLFQITRINWEESEIEELPSLSEHFIWGKEQNDSLIFKPNKAGKYCVCMLKKTNAMVTTSQDGYRIKGIKNNVATLSYKDSNDKRKLQPIIVQTVGIDNGYIESISVVDSTSSCDDEVVGSWMGDVYNYIPPFETTKHLEIEEHRFLIYTGFIFTNEPESLEGKLICTKYKNIEGNYPIGSVSEKNYIEYSHEDFNKLMGLNRIQPDYVYNFEAKHNLVKFNQWIDVFKNIINQRKIHSGSHGPDDQINSFIDRYLTKILHFEVYKEKNTVTIWIANKEDVIILPVYKFEVECPSKIRMVVDVQQVYLYVLMASNRLIVRYNIDEIESKYIIDQVPIISNDIVLYNPVDFEVLQSNELIKLLIIDISSSCLIIFSSDLKYIRSVCNKIGKLDIINPLSLTCSGANFESKKFDCFIVETTNDSIIWFTVDIENDEIAYVSNYITGSQVDDLDPYIGNITSLESLNYSDVRQSSNILIMLRENSEYGAILSADREYEEIRFVSKMDRIPGYNRLVSVRNAYNGPSDHKVMLIRKNYIKNPLFSGTDLEDIFEMSKDKYNIKMIITWSSFEGIIDFPKIEYKIPEKIFFKDSLSLQPIHLKDQRFKQKIVYFIKDQEDQMIFINNTFKINKLTGELTIKVDTIESNKFHLIIISSIFGVQKKTKLTFNFSCRNGEYYEDKICKKCPVGFYNSKSIQESDTEEWSKCTECPDNKSTKREGAESVEECTCNKGYTMIVDPETKIESCQKCRPGTYKSFIGPEPCVGSCYRNSVSTVYGCTTEEEMECKCLPGFYWPDNDRLILGCVECEKGYFCKGGLKSKRNKCPENSTSEPMSEDINDCVCAKGYQPLEEINIVDLLLDYEFNKTKITKCIPCEYDEYKNIESMDKCKKCPENSFSMKKGNKTRAECNKCKEGYYETNDIREPCKKCKKNKVCVGSVAKNTNMIKLSGKMINCPENSKTVGPNEMNNSILNCLCIEGYVPVITGSLLKCIPAPKNHYKDIVGNVEAIPCPYGSLTISNGATSKEQCVCDKGTYFDLTTQNCTICPTGKYCLGGKDENMKDRQPMDCGDVNALTKSPGASSISECACKAGYYMDIDSQNKCRECPENHYKSYVSNDMCTRCDENSSTSGKKGATSKEQCVCDPGYYFDNACISCNFNNKYCPGGVIEVNDDNGLTKIVTQSPITCPPNTEIAPGVDNASSISFCKCTKGYSFVSENLDINNKICDPCVPGTYKSSIMDSSCNGLCTQNATSLEGAVSSNQCFCRSGYFYLEGGICSKCMEGAICDGGLIDNDKLTNNSRFVVDIDDHTKPVAMEGYYLDKINTKLRKPDDWKFIKCPINNSCLGDDKCSNSMEHYLCSECKKGYTNNFVKGVLCQQCPKIIPNITITIVYYLVLLLINIVMACLNISAGFNRRSIHSVVIKIALNYAICTSVVNVINFSELKLPEGLRKITSSWTKIFDSEDVVYYTSIDCILRQLFNLEHSESFFYAMLYMAFLPVILLLVVTLLMLIILSLFKMKRYNDTRTKLALLHESEIKGMEKIADGLREQYENERLLMIFRYIPLPGQTGWVKFINFLEDMIPIYVTVLFSVHGKITSRMLSLLDCTYIDLGRSFPGKYMLGPAMSIKCSLSHSDGYLKYLILGLSGLIIWGFGIPFLSFIVLYINRKNLYAPSIRMKYGFLHNGYRQDYWFWETIVFTRKCLVLVIGSIVIVPSQNYSGSRIWMALVVAVIFLILQLIYKPFDERDYFVLGRLENHSMIAWTFTLILFSFIIEANFSSFYNLSILTIILLLNSLFVFELFFYLLLSIISCFSFLISKIFSRSKFRYFKLSQFAFSNEPSVLYDQHNSYLCIKSHSKNSDSTKDHFNLSQSDLNYLITSITYLYSVAVSHLSLDVVPSSFIEFLIRYSMSMANIENKVLEKRLFNEYSSTDLTKLIMLVSNEEHENLNKFVNLDINKENKSYGLFQKIENKLISLGFDKQEINVVVNSLFDDDLLYSELCLSDFFQSVTKLKNLDKRVLGMLYALFKHFKDDFDNKELIDLREQINKLKKTISDIKFGQEDSDYADNILKSIEQIKSEIDDLNSIKAKYERELNDLKEVESKYKMNADNSIDENNNSDDDPFSKDIQEFGSTKRKKKDIITEPESDDFE